jgi:CHASE2 domain-containing sensor protein
MAKARLFGGPWTRKRISQFLMRALLPTAIVACLLAVQYHDPLERMRLRDFAFDWLHKVHPGAYVEDVPVRVVAIDDKSLETLGQWPWPRTVLAQIIDQLKAFGARVVVLDLILAESDRTSPNVVKQFWPENAQLDALLQTFPSHDDILAAVFSQSRVVTGIQAFNSDTHRPSARAQDAYCSRGRRHSFLGKKLVRWDGQLPSLDWFCNGCRHYHHDTRSRRDSAIDAIGECAG